MSLLFNKRLLVSLLTAAYLFVSLTHISFIQRLNYRSVSAPTGIKAILKDQGSEKAPFLFSLKRIEKIVPEPNSAISKIISIQVRFFCRLFLYFSPEKSIPSITNSDLVGYGHLRPSFLCCFKL